MREKILLEEELQITKKKLLLAEKQINDIQKSLSFKIGRTITFPFRCLYSFANTIKSLPRHFELLTNKNKRLLKDNGVIFINKRKIIKNSKNLKPLSPIDRKKIPKLIVSLTSFPERTPDIFFNLYSLLNQTRQPDMLILWLAEEQFPNREKDLPKKVLSLQTYGLTIRWCKDLKSYKKLIFSLREFPDDIIITADDDIYYPEDWLELLYRSYQENPQYIHCHRAHQITFNDKKNISSYNEWPKCIKKRSPSYLNFCTTGGGVLYPPRSLHKEVLNEELFMKLCPTADDVWFWAMAVLNTTKIQVVHNNITELIYINPELEFKMTDGLTLNKINQFENDNQIKKTIRYYKKIKKIITKP